MRYIVVQRKWQLVHSAEIHCTFFCLLMAFSPDQYSFTTVGSEYCKLSKASEAPNTRQIEGAALGVLLGVDGDDSPSLDDCINHTLLELAPSTLD